MFRFSKDFSRGGAFMRGSQVILLNYRVAHIEMYVLNPGWGMMTDFPKKEVRTEYSRMFRFSKDLRDFNSKG